MMAPLRCSQGGRRAHDGNTKGYMNKTSRPDRREGQVHVTTIESLGTAPWSCRNRLSQARHLQAAEACRLSVVTNTPTTHIPRDSHPPHHTQPNQTPHIPELILDNMDKDHDETLAEESTNNRDEHTLTSPNDASVLQSTSSPQTRARRTRRTIYRLLQTEQTHRNMD